MGVNDVLPSVVDGWNTGDEHLSRDGFARLQAVLRVILRQTLMGNRDEVAALFVKQPKDPSVRVRQYVHYLKKDAVNYFVAI